MPNWDGASSRRRQKANDRRRLPAQPERFSRMSSRAIKQKVLQLLEGPDVPDILASLDALPAKDVIQALFSAICRTDEQIRWHGIRAMGRAVARLAGEDMEAARIVMRRLMWSLNEESGGIGWGAPEAMAEIMVQDTGLAEEYVHILISYMRGDGEELFQHGNFLENEALQRGLLWGIGRLAAERSDMLLQLGAAEDLPQYVHSADHLVRGLAARALGLLRWKGAREPIRGLLGDDAPVRVYEDDRMKLFTVADLARQALERIGPQDER